MEEWALLEDKIIVERAGVGQKTEKLSFVTSQVFCLDDYFKDQNVSFIKADIESYELNLLKGAVNIIRRDEQYWQFVYIIMR